MFASRCANGATNQATTPSDRQISVPAACLSIAASAAVILLLASLHVLSPEFDPSWRVVSEYSTGKYGWVLSLMFGSWALSSWALAIAIWSQLKTIAGKLGLAFLVAAGVGQAMASVYDLHHPLHGVAGLLGVLGLPIAAMLISVTLVRTRAWSPARKALLWTANFTWVIVVLMIASLLVMIVGRNRPGTIAIVGYPNRLLVVLDCVWVMTVAWQAIKRRNQPIERRQVMSGPLEEMQ